MTPQETSELQPGRDGVIRCSAWLDAIVCGDCLNEMPKMPAQSVDAIISDLPYGTTACKWDSVIPFAPLWAEWKRLLKPNGAIVLTASQPFTSALVMSNAGDFKYAWTWDRMVAPTGHLNAKKMPLRRTEDVLVFYGSQCTYNPQMGNGKPVSHIGGANRPRGVFGENKVIECRDVTSRYPVNLLQFKKVQTRHGRLHRTQKPVELMRYLVRTYTNPGDVILDPCCGSGTTCVAAMQEGRHYIGIEKETNYAEITKQRIYEARGLGV